MEIALTPLEFARRARRLYGDREAVVDGDLRLSYAAFFDRCDRWSSALQGLGVKKGDRVAYIAPNTHAHLEGYYAVPQIGAVLVPINYRLLPDDFAYIINHCGATVVCVHSDYIDAIDGIRGQLGGVKHFVALEGGGEGWIDYEARLAATVAGLRAAGNRRDRPADDQLHQRHDGAPKGRDDHASQRLSERGGHAGASSPDAGRALPVDAADVPRQRLDVHLDQHGTWEDARVPAASRAAADLSTHPR